MRFFTSDTHFWHRNIIQYSNRPFDSVEHMNEILIANWNSTVAPEDTIYHLGDVALGPWSEWEAVLSRLNGYKILVVGNHERIFKGEKPRMQERFADYYHQFFDEVHHNLRGVWLDNGTIVDLSHFPYEADHMEKSRHMEHRLPDTGRTLIHGHTHAEYAQHGNDARVSRSKRGTLQIHVGMDAWNYTPVSEDQIIELIESA